MTIRDPMPTDTAARPRLALATSARRGLSGSSVMRARSGTAASRGLLDRTAEPMHETELSGVYRQVAASLVERLVAVEMGVTVDALHTRTRSSAEVAFARQVAMYLASTIFCMSKSEIGARFRRDRTTVKHACERVEDRRDDAAFEARLRALEALLEDARFAMQLFAVQRDTITERILVEIGAVPNGVEDRR